MELALAVFLPLAASAASLFPRPEKAKAWLVTAGTLASAALATYVLLLRPPSPTYPWLEGVGAAIAFGTGWPRAEMGALVAWLVAAIAIYSVKYMEGDYRPGWYWFFFGFFATSMLVVVYATNLWLLLVGWEGVGLASWALIGHWYRDEEEYWVGRREKVAGVPYWWTPSVAGLRAMLTVRFGDSFFIVAIALLYVLLGTADLDRMASSGGLPALSFLPLLFFALGPLTKSAQFPFHEWLLTAMTGPTSVSALIHAATMVKAGVYLLIVTAPIFALAAGAQAYFTLVLVVGVVTAFATTLMALTADEFKLVLAGSTAANLGLIAAAAGAAGLLGMHDPRHMAAYLALAFGQVWGHAISKASLFMGFGAVIHEAGTRFMGAVGRLARHMPITAAAMFLATFSLAGIPPFAGAFTKEGAAEAVAEASPGVLQALLYLTLFLTPIYGMRLLGLTFLHGEEKEAREAPFLMWGPYAALAAASLALGLPLLPQLKPTTALGVTLLGLAVGLALYVARPGVSLGPLTGLWKAAHRRLYLPLAYDWALPAAFTALSRGIYVAIDRGLFDGLYHWALPSLFSTASRGFRRLVTGDVGIYVLYAVVGIAILLLLGLLAGI